MSLLAKKQLINAFIDLETYLALKSQEANVSELVRNALRAAVSAEIPEEEQHLLDLIDEDKKMINDASKRLSVNSMKLAILRDRRKKDEANREINLDSVEDTLREAMRR